MYQPIILLLSTYQWEMKEIILLKYYKFIVIVAFLVISDGMCGIFHPEITNVHQWQNGWTKSKLKHSYVLTENCWYGMDGYENNYDEKWIQTKIMHYIILILHNS